MVLGTSSSIALSDERSMVCLEAEEADEARLRMPAGPAAAAAAAFTSPFLRLFSLVLLDPAWLVEGVIGVLGVADDAAAGRGVFAGAFLKKPSRLDCFCSGLLMLDVRVCLC
jgi:hypothetical protein